MIIYLFFYTSKEVEGYGYIIIIQFFFDRKK